MNNQRVYVYGQSTGQGSYKAPTSYNQQGPKVQGNDRYDNYGGQGYQYGDKKEHMSGCEKCCACLGALACCCCVMDCLT